MKPRKPTAGKEFPEFCGTGESSEEAGEGFTKTPCGLGTDRADVAEGGMSNRR